MFDRQSVLGGAGIMANETQSIPSNQADALRAQDRSESLLSTLQKKGSEEDPRRQAAVVRMLLQQANMSMWAVTKTMLGGDGKCWILNE